MVIRHPKTGTAISFLLLGADKRVHVFAHFGMEGVTEGRRSEATIAYKSPCGMSRIHTHDPSMESQETICPVCKAAAETWALRGRMEISS